MAKGVWGIDVSRYSVKAVRLEEAKDGLYLTDVEVLPYKVSGRLEDADLEGRIVETLKDLKYARKIGGEPVALSLPTHSSFNRLIKLPPVEDVDKAVHYEAQSQIPFPLDQVRWGYQIIERQYQPGEEKEVVLIAIKREIVENFLKTIEEVGLNVVQIQLSPVALYNFLVADQDTSRPMIVLEMGADNSSLIVIEHERFWIRNLPVTGGDLTKALMETFNLPFEKAEALKIGALQSPHVDRIYQALQPVYKNIVSEIHRSLGYYKSMSRQARFDRILLLGNGTKALNFQRFMSQALQIQAGRIQKLNTIALTGSVDPRTLNVNLQSLGTCLGLALQALGRTRNRVNLLPGEFLKKKQIRKKFPVVAASLALLYVLFFFAYGRLGEDAEELERFRREQERTLTEVEEVQRRFEEVQKVQGLQKAAGVLEKLANARSPIRTVMAALLEHFPDNSSPQLKDHQKLWLLRLEAAMREEGQSDRALSRQGLAVVSPERNYVVQMDVAITLHEVDRVQEKIPTGLRERTGKEAQEAVTKLLFPGGTGGFRKKMAAEGILIKEGMPVITAEKKLENLVLEERDRDFPGPGPLPDTGSYRFQQVVVRIEFSVPGARKARVDGGAGGGGKSGEGNE